MTYFCGLLNNITVFLTVCCCISISVNKFSSNITVFVTANCCNSNTSAFATIQCCYNILHSLLLNIIVTAVLQCLLLYTVVIAILQCLLMYTVVPAILQCLLLIDHCCNNTYYCMYVFFPVWLCGSFCCCYMQMCVCVCVCVCVREHALVYEYVLYKRYRQMPMCMRATLLNSFTISESGDE